MGAVEKFVVTVSEREWCDDFDRLLMPAFSSPEYLVAARSTVESGDARLFAILQAGDIVGAYVLRVDYFPGFSEGVVVALAAKRADFPVAEVIDKILHEQFNGVSRVRFHTTRPAMARKMAAHGYRVSELVLSKG